MSHTILINGVNRTADVVAQSPKISDAINDQVNTLTLGLVDRSSSGIPSNDEEVIILLDGGEKIFGGYITKVSMTKQSQGYVLASIECVDYVRILDKNLVHKTYEDMTDAEIIMDIVNTYCSGSGITTTNVIEGVTIDQISFNYLQPSQVLRKICDLTGRNWYIDYDKDIHYFPLTTDSAPFDITDSSGTNFFNLKINKDATQLKNRVYVRGGTKLSDTTFYEEAGDGTKTSFVLPDKPHNVVIKVNGVTKSLGIKNVDTTGYDWYLNFQEKYVEQDAGGVVLTSSDTLRVEYQYDIPILVAVEDTDSIATNGVKEFAIFDKSITTTQAARDRASAELTDYANSLIEGSFSTYTNGFRSGQYVNINRTDFDVNDDYIIQKVQARSTGGGVFVYEISIASAKTMGIIRFLIELLEANKNLIELDSNEVVDELFMCADSLLSDSLVDALTIDSAGAYATWCTNSAQSTPTTRARWGLFQWG